MHLALYRSERPERFDEIIGQKHIVKILRNQIKNDNVSQAYLFTGTRGTGKTTTARILAKALNCTSTDPGIDVPCGECENCRAIKDGRFLDVIELDAASNNGVENLRQITESVQYPPTVGKYKVYIIDEAHMLTDAAENAFLKTLEEPPAHVVFILATTNPEKVKATIKSRCLTLNFRHVSEEELAEGMKRICNKKRIAIEADALSLLARKADGSVRDGLSLLEQCITAGDENITRDLVLEYTGGAGDEFYLELTSSIKHGNPGEALTSIAEMIKAGKDAKQLLADWMLHYRNLMISKYVSDPTELIKASQENIYRIKEQAELLENSEINFGIRLLSETVEKAKYSSQPRILLETAVIKLVLGENVAASPAEQASRAVPAYNVPGVNPKIKEITKANISSLDDNKSNNDLTKEPKPLIEKKYNPFEGAAEDRHIMEFEANDNLNELWTRICDIVIKRDPTFKFMVQGYSRLVDQRDGELLVEVKNNKTRAAEDSKDNMEAAAKKICGNNCYITLKSVEYNPASLVELHSDSTQNLLKDDFEEPDEKDKMIEELAKDVANLFGVDEVNIK